MYIRLCLQIMHCLYIQSNTRKNQRWRGFQRVEYANMGCRGSEVQILSCRPKNSQENQPIMGWFFMSEIPWCNAGVKPV